MSQKMKDMPENERPCEKCLKFGAQVLSDAELLAVVIRSGIPGENSVELARRILTEGEKRGLPGLRVLLDLTEQELMEFKGVGRIKAAQLKCIGEIAARITAAGTEKRLEIGSPELIADYFMERLRHEAVEMMYVLMFDVRCRLIGEILLAKGAQDTIVIEPKEVFREALRHRAKSIVLVHNHPSGDPAPSEQDLSFTARVGYAGEMLGIRLMDHVIIGDKAYTSIYEMNLRDKSFG